LAVVGCGVTSTGVSATPSNLGLTCYREPALLWWDPRNGIEIEMLQMRVLTQIQHAHEGTAALI